MDERERIETEREPRTVERHTTVVTTDGGGRGGGTLLAVVLLIALLVVLFLVFGDRLMGGSDTNLDINVKAPDIEMPKVGNGG
jgi:predicted metalloprotease